MGEAAPECSATCVRAGDLIARARLGRRARLRVMVGVGLRMMFHDKLKFVGTVAGVIVAVVLSLQQVGILLGLLQRNTMFIDNAGADVWIIPPETQTLQPGQHLSSSVLMRARVTPGVAIASPLVLSGGSVLRPGGGTEAVTVIGTELPHRLGGPWNIVAGDPSVLSMPDTMFFEDSKRQDLGGINLGSVRELNGRRVKVGGFTWGLQPFGPPYAFAELETARRLTDAARELRCHGIGARVLPDPDDHEAHLVARRAGQPPGGLELGEHVRRSEGLEAPGEAPHLDAPAVELADAAEVDAAEVLPLGVLEEHRVGHGQDRRVARHDVPGPAEPVGQLGADDGDRLGAASGPEDAPPRKDERGGDGDARGHPGPHQDRARQVLAWLQRLGLRRDNPDVRAGVVDEHGVPLEQAEESDLLKRQNENGHDDAGHVPGT